MSKSLSLFGFVFLFYCNNTYSQNKSLTDTINEVRAQGVQIIYSNQHFNSDNYRLEGSPEETSFLDLKKYLKTIGFEMIAIKSNIYIIKAKTNNTIKDSGIVVLSIYDRESAVKLLNVSTQILELPNHEILQQNGVFSIINLPKTTHTLIITAENYFSTTLQLNLINQQVIVQDVFMLAKPKSLENITVTTSQYDFEIEKNTNHHIASGQELRTTPHIGNDPARAISKLPGLTGNGISARNYVRGGKQSESGVILNGLHLNDPYHFDDFFGLFSIIDLSYTQDIALYAGVFPSKFGNHISSVMEINSIQTNRPFFLDSSLNVFNSHFTVGGKISNTSQYIASFRSGGDFFETNVLDVNAGNPQYDDGFLSMSHDFSNGMKIQGNYLFSDDEIAINIINENETANAREENENLWFTVNNISLNKATINSQFYYQRTQSERSGTLDNALISGSLYNNIDSIKYGFSLDTTLDINNQAAISFGLDWSKLDNYSLYKLSKSSSSLITPLLNQELNISRNYKLNQSGRSLLFFANIRYKFTPLIVSDFGIRFDQQSWISQNQISPRLNISYFHDDSTTFRLGIGRHQQVQNLDKLLFEDESLIFFSPEIADIIILEATKKLSHEFLLRAEIYYKNYANVQPYYENLFVGLRLSPELFEDRIRIAPDSAHAKGIDISLSKSYNNLFWSASYSYSSIEDVFDNTIQKRSWDQKNGLKLNANWQINKWGLSSLLTYHSGWPRTIIAENAGELIISERNSDRFKDYINLDLRVEYHFNIKKTDSSMWFQLSNALDRDNQCCTEFTYELNNNQVELSIENKKWFPILPSVGINFYFD